MNQYLLDTNICIYYIKGLHDLKSKFEDVGPENCFISEITLAELKFGVANSKAKEKNQKALDNFLSGVQILHPLLLQELPSFRNDNPLAVSSQFIANLILSTGEKDQILQ